MENSQQSCFNILVTSLMWFITRTALKCQRGIAQLTQHRGFPSNSANQNQKYSYGMARSLLSKTRSPT